VGVLYNNRIMTLNASVKRTCVWGAVLCGSILLAGAAAAQTVPAGWKVINDSKKLCQVAVPADWTPDAIFKSMAISPDQKSNVVVHGLPAGTDYKTVVENAKKLFPPVKIFEESATRIWFQKAPPSGKTVTDWYFAIRGAQACNAEIVFGGAVTEDTAKKIVGTLAPAAK